MLLQFSILTFYTLVIDYYILLNKPKFILHKLFLNQYTWISTCNVKPSMKFALVIIMKHL